MTTRNALIESIGPDAWPDNDAAIIERIREAMSYSATNPGYAKYLLGDALIGHAVDFIADVKQIEAERVGE